MKRYIVATTLLSAIVLSFMPAPVFAQSTIETRICDESHGAQLTILSPASDSLVNDSRVTITGESFQSNQLEVLINGNFNSIVPLASAASSYETVIQLPIGTHTVTVMAADACQVQDASQSIVVTYQPVQAPSTGSDVPTGISEEGDTIGIAESVNESIDDPSISIVDRFINPVFNGVIDSFDLQTSHPEGTEPQRLTNMNRFLMTTSGIVLLFAAPTISVAASTWVASGIGNVPAFRRSARRAVRGVGIVLILLIFIL